MGAEAPYAALIITHLSVVSSRQRSIMISEDVMKRKTKNQRRSDDDSMREVNSYWVQNR